MELKIYNQADELKLTVSTSSSSTLNRELMVENAISASFTHFLYVPLEVNDYAVLEGMKYSINKEYKPKQRSTQEYAYSVKFYGPEHDAERVMYLNLTDGQYNPQFSLDGSPREHMQKWVDNMNRIYGREMWSLGDIVIAANKTIDYNNLTCWDALISIAETFETEWWADRFVMNLSRCERGERVALGYMQGLTSLTQSENSENVKFFTRLIPLGSTKNIDYSRYGHTRLQLSDKSTYVDRNTQYGIYEYVEESAFTEIFPKYTGTVSSVRSEEKTGDNGKKFTVYYFKDSGMLFEPNENEIAGLVKHVSFQSGDLNGRDFEANWNSATKEWEIINDYPSEDTQIPGGNLIPEEGYKYIPWNFRMPVEYEIQAEQDYKAAVDDFIEKYSEDVSKYGGDTDYIYIDKNGIPLQIGQSARLISDEYFGEIGYRDTRMTKVVRKLDNLSMATIECSNQVGQGWKKQVDSSLSGLKYVIGEMKKETVIDVLKTWDLKEPNNYNVFSALKSLSTFLRKDIADFTNYLVTFFKGLRIGKFVSGMIGGAGAQITPEGDAEMRSLILRDSLTVPKITFNCIDVISGDKANTFAFGTVKSVDTENQTAELELLEDELGTLRANDICRGVFHNLEGGNKEDNTEDDNGFLNYSGFSTSYFTPLQILINEAGRMQFRYVLQADTTVHPMKGMNFYAYGNFNDKSRQAITYENRYYTRRLKNVNTWVTDPDRNIAMQDGLLEGLAIGGITMHGYGTYEENAYLIGPVIQFTPQQKEELKGESAYGVTLSSYEMAVIIDANNNVTGGLTNEVMVTSGNDIVVAGSDNKTVVANVDRLSTRIHVTKGGMELFYTESYQKGGFMASINPVGCVANVSNGVVTVTEILDTDNAYIEITVNCEGNISFDKIFKITVLKNGRDGQNGADATMLVPTVTQLNENANGKVTPAGFAVEHRSASGSPIPTNMILWYTTDGITYMPYDYDWSIESIKCSLISGATGYIVRTYNDDADLDNIYADNDFGAEFILSVSVNVVKDGKDGTNGCMYRNWNGFTTGQTFRNDEGVTDPAKLEAEGVRYIDVVLIENSALDAGAECYIAKKYGGLNAWVGTTDNDPRNEMFTGNESNHWTKANALAPVFTKLLIAGIAVIDFAQIGSFVYNGYYTFSQEGVDINGDVTNDFGAFGTGAFIPNYQVNGKTGDFMNGGGKNKLNSDGSGSLANDSIIWDSVGNLLLKGILRQPYITIGLTSGESQSVDLSSSSNFTVEYRTATASSPAILSLPKPTFALNGTEVKIMCIDDDAVYLKVEDDSKISYGWETTAIYSLKLQNYREARFMCLFTYTFGAFWYLQNPNDFTPGEINPI